MKKKISIIIATYNAQHYLSKCLDSIVVQKSDDIELIIIDGKSSDGTVDIICQYEKYIDKWISEKDQGIYDAWNKGIQLSVGEWVQFIGSDDTYVENALCEYLNFIKKCDNGKIDIVSANVILYTQSGKLLSNIGKAYSWNDFKYYMSIPHPSVLHSRHFLDKSKMFDVSFKSSGDYELIYRGGKFLRAVYLDRPIVDFYLGGTSFSLIGLNETFKIHKKYQQISLIESLYMYMKGLIKLVVKRMIWH